MPGLPRLTGSVALPIGQSLGPRISLSAVQAPGAGLAAVGDALSGPGVEFLARRLEARRAIELAGAAAEGSVQLADLETAFSRDPDFVNAETGFLAAADEFRDARAEAIEDGAVRRHFVAGFDKLKLAKKLNVRDAAFKREMDAARAALDAALPQYARAIAAAGSDAERAELLGQARAAIAGPAAAGIITRQNAVARLQRLDSDVSEAEVRGLITADPEGAVLALLDGERFPGLDPVARARLTDTAVARADSALAERARVAEAAERAAEKEIDAEADALLKGLYAADADGTLTREDVDALEGNPGVTPAEFKSALKLTSPDAEDIEDDPEIFVSLELMLGEDPAGAKSLAKIVHGQGLIKNETLRSVVRKADELLGREERAAEAGRPDNAYKRFRSMIIGKLKPAAGIDDPVRQNRLADVLVEYDDFFLSDERRSEDLRAFADDLVRRNRLVNLTEEFFALALPRFGNIPNPRTAGDLAAKQAALNESRAAAAKAFLAGDITEAEAQREALLQEDWQRAIDEALSLAAEGTP